MEVALRQRLAGVASISISEGEQTAEVIFAPGDHPFSVETFRGALKQADVEVVTMNVEACGDIDQRGSERRLRAGALEFVLRGGTALAAGRQVCIAGRLQENAGQLNLFVDRVDDAAPPKS